MATGRFSQAVIMPLSILLRSNGSLLPSLLTTITRSSSISSYVVNRRPHPTHSRLRLMVSSFLMLRESRTLSSLKPQYGHFIVGARVLHVVVAGIIAY